MTSPTPSRYQWEYQGARFDFYRLCEILDINSHAQAHALKKIIRAGKSVKSLKQDIDEAIDCLNRWKEMVIEDKLNVKAVPAAAGDSESTQQPSPPLGTSA